MRKTSRLIVTTFLSSALALVANAQSSQEIKVTPEIKTAVLTKLSETISSSVYVPGVDFSKWSDYLKEYQPAIDKAQNASEFSIAVNNALAKFGVSHIVFNTPQAATQFFDRKFVGIGIQPELTKEGLRILNVFPNSAAATAGLQPGDILIEADGSKITKIDQLRGEAGTKVVLKVKRYKTSKTEAMTLTRAEFSTAIPETLEWARKDVAVVKIPSFLTSYDANNIAKIMDEAKDAKAMIVDVRSNGGGAVMNLLSLLGYFLPDNKAIGAFVTRGLARSFVKETSGKETDLKGILKYSVENNRGLLRGMTREKTQFKGKLVVLVDPGTGSASEMFAAGLRDVLGATVIGQKSAGAVLASTMRPLSNNYMLQYPFQDYITINGLRLEGNGVVPDIETKGMPTFGNDPGVNAAVKFLVEKAYISKKAS